MLGKNKTVRTIVLVIAAAAILAACNRVKPVIEIQNELIPQLATPLTMSQIEAGIMTAGTQNGWQMNIVKPGELRGKIAWQNHSGTVRIEYDTVLFSILYHSSHRLKFGMGMADTTYEGMRVIHNRYNQHVVRLKRKILTVLRSTGS